MATVRTAAAALAIGAIVSTECFTVVAPSAARVGVSAVHGESFGATGSTSSSSISVAGAATVGVLAVAAGQALSRKRTLRTSAVAMQAKPFAGGLVGGESAFGGDFNFDPLGLAEKFENKLPYFREAELKHGRICMLAWVGLVAQEGPRLPIWPESCTKAANAVEAHQLCIGTLYQKDIGFTWGSFEDIGPLGVGFWLIGFIEVLTTKAKTSDEFLETFWYGGIPEPSPGLTLANAGDYQLGANFLPADEAKAREMKLKELKNGRLAMLAFGGAITQATITGHGFPWLSAERQHASSGLSSSVSAPKAALAGRSSAVARRAEAETDDGFLPYKMSKAVPFLPLSPALETMVGGEEEGFDPIGVSLSIDSRWLREAELKHSRVAMLATVGWAVTDLGVRLPGEAFQVSTVKAHNVMVLNNTLTHMLIWFGVAEFFGALAIIKAQEGKTDRAPGDFGFRALYPSDAAGQYQMQLKELRNGRLAMLAIGGMATLGVFTGQEWPTYGLFAQAESSTISRTASALCGSRPKASARSVTRAALERSSSLPFLDKPQNLQDLPGSEQEFDPVGFSDTFDIKWMREAEIKHGRVAMLATVGFLVTSTFTLPGATPEADSLKAFYSAPPGLWAALIFLAGYAESSGYSGTPVGFGQTAVPKANGISILDMFEGSERVPGDFGFRALYPSDPAGQRQMQTKEINNGRLAMFAIGGMVHHNLVVSAGLFPLFPDGWKGPYNTWKAVSFLDIWQKLNPEMLQ